MIIVEGDVCDSFIETFSRHVKEKTGYCPRKLELWTLSCHCGRYGVGRTGTCSRRPW